MKNHFIFLVLGFTIQLSAQTFEGTIGEYPILLSLDIDDNQRATAFYLYKSKLKHIALEGQLKEAELILYEQFSDLQEEKELFTLSQQQNKLVGTWKNKGRLLQVALMKTNQSIDVFKEASLVFIRDSSTTVAEKELVWFTEKYSKQVLFRLGNGFAKAKRDFINPLLDRLHISYAMMGLDCSWAEVHIDLELISEEYLSFTETSSVYCGGAHPSHSVRGHNFDLKNKRQLNRLRDLFPHADPYQLIKNKYENDGDLESECEYFTAGEVYFQNCTWVLTKDGVTITPSYPHALSPCEIGFTLSYEELE